jgi:hypothetical protein
MFIAMVVTHTTETVPMMNCGEWYVFARIGDQAWKCITEQRYEEIQEHCRQVTINAFIAAVIITAVIFLAIWLHERH